MYIQITNTTLSKFNQIRVDNGKISAALKQQGWDKADCKFASINDDLVDKKYRGTDGKNVPNGRKQYKARAVSKGTHNMKSNYGTRNIIQTVEAVVE